MQLVRYIQELSRGDYGRTVEEVVSPSGQLLNGWKNGHLAGITRSPGKITLRILCRSGSEYTENFPVGSRVFMGDKVAGYR